MTFLTFYTMTFFDILYYDIFWTYYTMTFFDILYYDFYKTFFNIQYCDFFLSFFIEFKQKQENTIYSHRNIKHRNI